PGKNSGLLRAVAYELKKFLMDPRIVAELGMECCGHRLPFPHNHRVVAFGGDYFHTWSELLNLWSGDKHHLQRRIAQFAGADGTVDLATIGVSTDSDVESAQPGLRRVGNFLSQHDGARARAEGRFHAHEFLELGEALLTKNSQKGSRL